MKALLKILNKLQQSKQDNITRNKPSPDSLPYACHYSPETILTKNGELLQIMKIEDFHSDRDIRSILRSSIVQNINDNNFALTIHTIRKKKNISIPWNEKYQQGFPYALHQSWQINKQSSVEYTSEIYVTIIARGIESILSTKNFLSNFSFLYIRKKHEKYLSGQYKKLTELTDKILEDLVIFQAKKLNVDKNNNSELLFFLKSLVTLLTHQEDIPLPIQDLSTFLLEGYNNAHGFNTIEMLYKGQKKFAMVLAIKRYREVEVGFLSRAIQFKKEFIITESIDFDENSLQDKKIKKQKYLLEISHDETLHQVVALEEFSLKEKCVNHYINIIPIANNIRALNAYVDEFVQTLYECGLSIFRHDISLESAFLSIMPANFAFKTLSDYTTINNTAGFALLHSLNAGRITCEQWGYAIALFWSVYNTPYFFNFHTRSGGHTTIIGPAGAGKTILQNFIISESKKIGTKVFMIDKHAKSNVFINALNGEYKNISLDHDNLPCSISHDNDHLIYDIIRKMAGKKADEELIKTTADKINSLSIEEYNSEKLHELLSPLDQNIEKWFSKEKYIDILLQAKDEESFWHSESIGFDFGILPNYVVVVLVSIILHKIENILDGSPALLILDEAWKISAVFANSKILDDFLDRMSKLNCIVVFTSSDTEDIITNNFTAYLNTKVSTQIFLPGNITHKGYLKPFNITKEDLLMISNLQSHNRHFFVKQGPHSIVLKLNLSGLEEAYVLSSNKKNISDMKEAMLESNSKDSSEWLPLFYNKTKK